MCVCVYGYVTISVCVCKFPVCALISTCVCVCWNLWCVFVFCRWGLRGQQLPFTSAALTRYGFPHGSENTDVMYERMSATPPGVTQETDMKLKSIRPADSFSLLFLSLSVSPSVSHRSYSPSTSPSFSPPRVHPCCSLVSHFCLPLS